MPCRWNWWNTTVFAAARFFGVSQPRISDLQRGKIGLFTVDTLITMLSKAGMNVNARLTKKRAA